MDSFVVISLPCVNSSLHYRWKCTAGGDGIRRVKATWSGWRDGYQETYHEATYARHHLKGKKRTSSGGWKRRIGWAVRGLIRRPRRANWPFRQLAR